MPMFLQSTYDLPYRIDSSEIYRYRPIIKQFADHVAAGGQVHIEILEGARSGTIGRVSNVDFAALYRTVPTGQMYLDVTEWDLAFDDLLWTWTSSMIDSLYKRPPVGTFKVPTSKKTLAYIKEMSQGG